MRKSKYEEVYELNDGYAVCKLCGQLVKWQSASGTSTLRFHLSKKHEDHLLKLDEETNKWKSMNEFERAQFYLKQRGTKRRLPCIPNPKPIPIPFPCDPGTSSSSEINETAKVMRLEDLVSRCNQVQAATAMEPFQLPQCSTIPSALMMPVVTMERVEMFSAAHRLHSPKLSDEDNRRIFGKCNNPNGHGHNYVWRAILRGPVDEITGMVYDLAELKAAMSAVMDTIDHKNVDKDIPYFSHRVSTSENVCIYLYEELKKNLSKPELLDKCVLEETPKNIFSYSG